MGGVGCCVLNVSRKLQRDTFPNMTKQFVELFFALFPTHANCPIHLTLIGCLKMYITAIELDIAEALIMYTLPGVFCLVIIVKTMIDLSCMPSILYSDLHYVLGNSQSLTQ